MKPFRPRLPPKVGIVYEVAVARRFLDAGYDFVRQSDGSLVLRRDDHRVPVYKAVALHFESRSPTLILKDETKC